MGTFNKDSHAWTREFTKAAAAVEALRVAAEARFSESASVRWVDAELALTDAEQALADLLTALEEARKHVAGALTDEAAAAPAA